MKKSSRSYLILSLMALVMMTSRCDCSRASTSSGRCEGFIGGLAVSDEIDPESFYAIDYDNNLDLIDVSFGQRKVVMNAVVTRATVLSGGVELNLPSEVAPGGSPGGMDGGTGGTDGGTGGADGGTGGTDGGTGGADGGTGFIPAPSPEIKQWTLVTQAPRPNLRRGTLERVVTFVELRLSTTLKLFFEDGTSLVCEFQVRHDEENDRGTDSSGSGGCLPESSGGGDSDFD
jgi:hypothetical protein